MAAEYSAAASRRRRRSVERGEPIEKLLQSETEATVPASRGKRRSSMAAEQMQEMLDELQIKDARGALHPYIRRMREKTATDSGGPVSLRDLQQLALYWKLPQEDPNFWSKNSSEEALLRTLYREVKHAHAQGHASPSRASYRRKHEGSRGGSRSDTRGLLNRLTSGLGGSIGDMKEESQVSEGAGTAPNPLDPEQDADWRARLEMLEAEIHGRSHSGWSRRDTQDEGELVPLSPARGVSPARSRSPGSPVYYGGDLFGQRGEYHDGMIYASRRRPVGDSRPLHPRAQDQRPSNQQPSARTELEEEHDDSAAPADENATSAFLVLRQSATAALANLARRPTTRREIASEGAALQTLFDTWRTTDSSDIRRNCALALCRVYTAFDMPHDDMILPVLGLCVAENGVGVMASAMRALHRRYSNEHRPVDIIYLPGIIAAVQSVVGYRETTMLMRRFCAELLHLALLHSQDTHMDADGDMHYPVPEPPSPTHEGKGKMRGGRMVRRSPSFRMTTSDRTRELRLASRQLAKSQRRGHRAGGGADSGNPVFGGVPPDDPYAACRVAVTNGLVPLLTRLLRVPPPERDGRDIEAEEEEDAAAAAAAGGGGGGGEGAGAGGALAINVMGISEDDREERGPPGTVEDDDAMREACTRALVLVARLPGTSASVSPELGVDQVLPLLLSLLDARSRVTKDMAAHVLFELAAGDGHVSREITQSEQITRRLVQVAREQGDFHCRPVIRGRRMKERRTSSARSAEEHFPPAPGGSGVVESKEKEEEEGGGGRGGRPQRFSSEARSEGEENEAAGEEAAKAGGRVAAPRPVRPDPVRPPSTVAESMSHEERTLHTGPSGASVTDEASRSLPRSPTSQAGAGPRKSTTGALAPNPPPRPPKYGPSPRKDEEGEEEVADALSRQGVAMGRAITGALLHLSRDPKLVPLMVASGGGEALKLWFDGGDAVIRQRALLALIVLFEQGEEHRPKLLELGFVRIMIAMVRDAYDPLGKEGTESKRRPTLRSMAQRAVGQTLGSEQQEQAELRSLLGGKDAAADRCAQALRALTEAGPEAVHHLLEEGVVRALVLLVQYGPARSRKESLRALRALVDYEEAWEPLLKANTVPVLVSAAFRFRGNGPAQRGTATTAWAAAAVGGAPPPAPSQSKNTEAGGGWLSHMAEAAELVLEGETRQAMVADAIYVIAVLSHHPPAHPVLLAVRSPRDDDLLLKAMEFHGDEWSPRTEEQRDVQKKLREAERGEEREEEEGVQRRHSLRATTPGDLMKVEAGTIETLVQVALERLDLRPLCLSSLCHLSAVWDCHSALIHHGVLPLLASYARAVDSSLRLECAQAAYNLSCVEDMPAIFLQEGPFNESGRRKEGGLLFAEMAMLRVLGKGASRELQLFRAGVASALTIGALFRSDDPVIKDLAAATLVNLARCPVTRGELLADGVLWALVKLGADGRAAAEAAQESGFGEGGGGEFRGSLPPTPRGTPTLHGVTGVHRSSSPGVQQQEDRVSPLPGNVRRPRAASAEVGLVVPSGGRRGSLLLSPHGLQSRRASREVGRALGLGSASPVAPRSTRGGARAGSPIVSRLRAESVGARGARTPSVGSGSEGEEEAASPYQRRAESPGADEPEVEGALTPRGLRERLKADPSARTDDRQLTCTRFLRSLATIDDRSRRLVADRRTVDALVGFSTSPHACVRLDSSVILAELTRSPAMCELLVRRGGVAAVWELMLTPDLPVALRAATAFLRLSQHRRSAVAISCTGNTGVPMLTSFISFAERLLNEPLGGRFARTRSGSVYPGTPEVDAGTDDDGIPQDALSLFGRHAGAGSGTLLPGEEEAMLHPRRRVQRARELLTRVVLAAATALCNLSAVFSRKNTLPLHGSVELIVRLCELTDRACPLGGSGGGVAMRHRGGRGLNTLSETLVVQRSVEIRQPRASDALRRAGLGGDDDDEEEEGEGEGKEGEDVTERNTPDLVAEAAEEAEGKEGEEEGEEESPTGKPQRIQLPKPQDTHMRMVPLHVRSHLLTAALWAATHAACLPGGGAGALLDETNPQGAVRLVRVLIRVLLGTSPSAIMASLTRAMAAGAPSGEEVKHSGRRDDALRAEAMRISRTPTPPRQSPASVPGDEGVSPRSATEEEGAVFGSRAVAADEQRLTPALLVLLTLALARYPACAEELHASDVLEAFSLMLVHQYLPPGVREGAALVLTQLITANPCEPLPAAVIKRIAAVLGASAARWTLKPPRKGRAVPPGGSDESGGVPPFRRQGTGRSVGSAGGGGGATPSLGENDPAEAASVTLGLFAADVTPRARLALLHALVLHASVSEKQQISAADHMKVAVPTSPGAESGDDPTTQSGRTRWSVLGFGPRAAPADLLHAPLRSEADKEQAEKEREKDKERERRRKKGQQQEEEEAGAGEQQRSGAFSRLLRAGSQDGQQAPRTRRTRPMSGAARRRRMVESRRAAVARSGAVQAAAAICVRAHLLRRATHLPEAAETVSEAGGKEMVMRYLRTAQVLSAEVMRACAVDPVGQAALATLASGVGDGAELLGEPGGENTRGASDAVHFPVAPVPGEGGSAFSGPIPLGIRAGLALIRSGEGGLQRLGTEIVGRLSEDDDRRAILLSLPTIPLLANLAGRHSTDTATKTWCAHALQHCSLDRRLLARAEQQGDDEGEADGRGGGGGEEGSHRQPNLVRSILMLLPQAAAAEVEEGALAVATGAVEEGSESEAGSPSPRRSARDLGEEVADEEVDDEDAAEATADEVVEGGREGLESLLSGTGGAGRAARTRRPSGTWRPLLPESQVGLFVISARTLELPSAGHWRISARSGALAPTDRMRVRSSTAASVDSSDTSVPPLCWVPDGVQLPHLIPQHHLEESSSGRVMPLAEVLQCVEDIVPVSGSAERGDAVDPDRVPHWVKVVGLQGMSAVEDPVAAIERLQARGAAPVEEEGDETTGRPPSQVDVSASWLSSVGASETGGHHYPEDDGFFVDMEETRDNLLVAVTSERLGLNGVGLGVANATSPESAFWAQQGVDQSLESSMGFTRSRAQPTTATSPGGGIIPEAEEALARVGNVSVRMVPRPRVWSELDTGEGREHRAVFRLLAPDMDPNKLARSSDNIVTIRLSPRREAKDEESAGKDRKKQQQEERSRSSRGKSREKAEAAVRARAAAGRQRRAAAAKSPSRPIWRPSGPAADSRGHSEPRGARSKSAAAATGGQGSARDRGMPSRVLENAEAWAAERKQARAQERAEAERERHEDRLRRTAHMASAGGALEAYMQPQRLPRSADMSLAAQWAEAERKLLAPNKPQIPEPIQSMPSRGGQPTPPLTGGGSLPSPIASSFRTTAPVPTPTAKPGVRLPPLESPASSDEGEDERGQARGLSQTMSLPQLRLAHMDPSLRSSTTSLGKAAAKKRGGPARRRVRSRGQRTAPVPQRRAAKGQSATQAMAAGRAKPQHTDEERLRLLGSMGHRSRVHEGVPPPRSEDPQTTTANRDEDAAMAARLLHEAIPPDAQDAIDGLLRHPASTAVMGRGDEDAAYRMAVEAHAEGGAMWRSHDSGSMDAHRAFLETADMFEAAEEGGGARPSPAGGKERARRARRGQAPPPSPLAQALGLDPTGRTGGLSADAFAHARATRHAGKGAHRPQSRPTGTDEKEEGEGAEEGEWDARESGPFAQYAADTRESAPGEEEGEDSLGHDLQAGSSALELLQQDVDAEQEAAEGTGESKQNE